MAKVSTSRLPGEFSSPHGAVVYLPIGQQREMKVEDMYWMTRCTGVDVEWDSDEEKAKADKLNQDDDDAVLKRPHFPENPNANASITIWGTDYVDVPIFVPYDGENLFMTKKGASQEIKVKLEQDALQEVVRAVLMAAASAGVPIAGMGSLASATPVDPATLPQTNKQTPGASYLDSRPGKYDNAVDGPESRRGDEKALAEASQKMANTEGGFANAVGVPGGERLATPNPDTHREDALKQGAIQPPKLGEKTPNQEASDLANGFAGNDTGKVADAETKPQEPQKEDKPEEKANTEAIKVQEKAETKQGKKSAKPTDEGFTP